MNMIILEKRNIRMLKVIFYKCSNRGIKFFEFARSLIEIFDRCINGLSILVGVIPP